MADFWLKHTSHRAVEEAMRIIGRRKGYFSFSHTAHYYPLIESEAKSLANVRGIKIVKSLPEGDWQQTW